jgi:hypothetical protein
MNLPIEPETGAKLEKSVAAIFQAKPDIVEAVKSLMAK